MAHKFKQGDPVYYTAPEEYKELSGLYTVQKISPDGLTYRIIDTNLNYTDVEEKELTHILYAVFIRIPEGWPLIVPLYDGKLFNYYQQSPIYKFVCESTASDCIEKEHDILKKLENR